ncbi:MAG: M23 family metallopeptidase [Deltaproteobacteria bacterium]|nr:MAG: M23 family metallopeptidase [Deltaproteobacteria bacterium]
MSELDAGATSESLDGPGESSELVRLREQNQGLKRQVRSLIGVGALIVIAFGVALPRSLTYPQLVEENLELKGSLEQMDARVDEMDRLLLRLRLYDAQLRSLTDPLGPSGPLHHTMGEGEGEIEDVPAARPGLDGLAQADEMLLLDDARPDLRPAEEWAAALDARADTFLSTMEAAEPDVSWIVEELEELRALEEALPSRWPAKGQLTSTFGYRRDPLDRRQWAFHAGIDISNKRGAPIYAAASGRVVESRTVSGYGKKILLDHGFGITTTYAHCSLLHVEEGDIVERGQLIGRVGSTGRVSGPHLHFEVRLDGQAVDPLDYIQR